MAYDITQVGADLESILHGTTLNNVTNLYGLYNRAARQLLLDIDPQETRRITLFANPIFNSIYDYAVPADLKGNKIVDVFPQANRMPWDVYFQQYNQDFDRLKLLNLRDTFSINFNNAVKTVRINAPSLLPPVSINDCSSITSNGTWAASGSASNLQVDNVNYVNVGGSLQFDLAAGSSPSTGTLTNSTMTAINLSAHLNQSTLFLYTYLPTGTDFTSIRFRWGSSASNYYESTATTQFDGTAFGNGWNLLSFVWSTATVVGSPSASAINYNQVVWTYDGTAQTATRLDSICSILGSLLNVEYYSKYLFRNATTGAFQETVLDNSDLINLDTETVNLFTNLVAFLATQQTQGADAGFDSNFFSKQYVEGIAKYKQMYKSEVQKPQTQYYIQDNPSPSQYATGRWGR